MNQIAFKDLIDVVQSLLSICVIPLIKVLWDLKVALKDLEISMERRFVTKEDLHDTEQRLRNGAENIFNRKAPAYRKEGDH